MDDSTEPYVSLPASVPFDFVRTGTLRVKPDIAGLRVDRMATDAQKATDAAKRKKKGRLLDARLRAWLGGALKALEARPDEFSAKHATSDAWATFVNAIEISVGGRIVLTVPNLHGWPFNGPMRKSDLDKDDIAAILRLMERIPREEPGTRFSTDAERAGPLLGSLLRTMHRDLHDLMCGEDDRCVLHVGIEQEDGLPTCVLDPSDSVEGCEPRAWHPPASAANAVPLRLSCERRGHAWRIDSRLWKEKIHGLHPPIMDPMEILRLCAPHAD